MWNGSIRGVLFIVSLLFLGCSSKIVEETINIKGHNFDFKANDEVTLKVLYLPKSKIPYVTREYISSDSFISWSATGWRDIREYQYFSAKANEQGKISLKIPIILNQVGDYTLKKIEFGIVSFQRVGDIRFYENLDGNTPPKHNIVTIKSPYDNVSPIIQVETDSNKIGLFKNTLTNHSNNTNVTEDIKNRNYQLFLKQKNARN